MMKFRRIGIVLSYVYFVLQTIVSIFLSSFVIRTIGKTDYGVYQSVSAFVGYLTLLEFGTGRIMSRNISLLKKDGSDNANIKKHISTILVLNGVLTIAILCFAVVFWLLIDVIYQNSMSAEQISMAKVLFLFPIGSLIISFFQQMFNGLLIGYENYAFEKVLSIVRLIIRTAIVIIALSLKNSIYLYVTIDLGISVVSLLVTIVFVVVKVKAPLSFFEFDKAVFKLVVPLCLAMLLQSIVTTVNGTLDKFLISIMMRPEDVTVYSIAMTIYSMYSSIGSLPIGMYMPKVASDMKSGLEGRELTKTLIQPCRLNILITGILGFGFGIVGRQFITILYGTDCVDAWLFAFVIMVPTFLNMSNIIILNVLDILRKRHVRSLILMITTALNLALTIFGIKYIGMLGAALATAIAMLLQVIILNIYYFKVIKIDVLLLFKEGFKGILIPLIIAIGCSLPILFFLDNIYLSFFGCGLAFVIVFAVLFCVFGSNDYEKGYIKKFLNKIGLKKGKI